MQAIKLIQAVYQVKDKSKPEKYLPLNDPTGMSRTFPNLTMESNIWGCYDPAAGVLMADKVVGHFNPRLFNPKLLHRTFQPQGPRN